MSGEKIKLFNDILDSFLIQVSPIIGTSYQYHFQQIIKVNSILPIEQFLIYAIPMRDKILNRDETYFTDNNSPIDKIGESRNILNEIIKFREIYSQVELKSRSNLWDIVQALLILGEEYLVMNKQKYIK